MNGTADPQVQTSAPPPAEASVAPLDDVMLAMDVVDTLRHQENLVLRELGADAREAQLLARLREIYRGQGIDVSDAILREGVSALSESRFVYSPPRPSFATSLARLYVSRRKWGPVLAALLLALLIGIGGYFLAYRPLVQSQAEAARIELAEALPARMDALYEVIYTETKVQRAVVEAEDQRTRGKVAAAEGDRAGAERAVAALEDIRDRLRQEYTLRIVNRPNERSGFWTFPEINTEATNYYVVVEAIDAEGNALRLPVLNEESGEIENVDIWGVRVPEAVYRSVDADKRDDGIIQRNIVGIKQYGFLDVDYAVPVLGGTVTRW